MKEQKPVWESTIIRLQQENTTLLAALEEIAEEGEREAVGALDIVMTRAGLARMARTAIEAVKSH